MQLVVREMSLYDLDIVQKIEENTLFRPSQHLSSPNCVFGLYNLNKFIGFCTITDTALEEETSSTDGYIQKCLRHVYILPDYRNKGCGTKLVSTAIANAVYNTEFVTVAILEESHTYFYNKLGFENDLRSEDGFATTMKKQVVA